MSSERQTFKSQYGRPGISVSAVCPTRSITRRLGGVHVGTPMPQVRIMIREAVAAARAAGEAGWTDAAEREAVRFAVWRHEENRAEYLAVMGRTSSWLSGMVVEHGHGAL